MSETERRLKIAASPVQTKEGVAKIEVKFLVFLSFKEATYVKPIAWPPRGKLWVKITEALSSGRETEVVLSWKNLD